jgi:hypothetical protein
MDTNKLLNRNLTYWPIEINIGDGEFLKDINGFKSTNLTNAWTIAEGKANGNDWDELAVWVIYSILHENAKYNFENKNYKILSTKIILNEFEEKLREALKAEGYEEMLKHFNS